MKTILNDQRVTIYISIVLLLIFNARSIADSSISKYVFSGGGKDIFTGAISLNDTIGQPGITGESASAYYSIQHGFWVREAGLPNSAYSSNLAGLVEGAGVAWGDFNTDGNIDFYITRGSTQKQDYLFQNLGGGIFKETSDPMGLEEELIGRGAGWADWNADGLDDLFVRNLDSNGILYQNRKTRFYDQTTTRGLQGISGGYSTLWADFDGDGLVDLFIAGANENPSRLFRNIANSQFQEISSQAGIIHSSDGIATAADIDNDGYLDIFIGQNSVGTNLLYHNKGDGTFEEEASDRGLASATFAGGAAFGDYDNDGFMDLYIPRHAGLSDILYHNNGNGYFNDVSTTATISDSADGNSATWGDINNDGYQEVFVTNLDSKACYLYFNKGNGTFQKAEATDPGVYYGAAWADFDNDGDMDLVATTLDSFYLIYRNSIRTEYTQTKNFLKIRPLDADGRKTCFGTQVFVYEAGTTNLVGMRQVDPGSGAGCQNMYDVHIAGLNPDGEYDIEVRFTRHLGGDQIIVNKNVNPILGGVQPNNVELGSIEVLESGFAAILQGILFESDHDDKQNIWITLSDGSDYRNLTETSNAKNEQPCWSPDGNKLVFVRSYPDDLVPAKKKKKLYIMKPDGSEVTPLMLNSPGDDYEPSWSPDGILIAFTSNRDGNEEIYVVDTAGNNPRNLTQHAASDKQPTWSPNANRIAFSTNRNGNWDIYSMAFDGSDVRLLTYKVPENGDNKIPPPEDKKTPTPENETDPNWGPDGLHIAYVEKDTNNSEIFIMNFNGTTRKSMTDIIELANYENDHPIWSLNGKEIIFSSNTTYKNGTGLYDLWSIDIEKKELKQPDPLQKISSDYFLNSDEKCPSLPVDFHLPPRTVVFGTRNGQTVYFADPVNTELGNYTYEVTDFNLPGFGDPLIFKRTYNSQDPLSGPLGYGWRHSYQIDIIDNVDNTVTLTWGDGHQDFYVWNNIEYVPAEANMFDTLTKVSGKFRVTKLDGSIYDFNTEGKILQIKDRNGKTLSFNYDSEGILCDIFQRNNRSLNFDTDSGRITGARAGSCSVSFTYDSAGNLATFTDKRGKSWTYVYDEHHRIVQIIDPNTKTKVRNEYGEDGRVSEQWDGKQWEGKQQDPNTTHTLFKYYPLERVATVTDALGRTYKHHYNNRRMLIKVTGPDNKPIEYVSDSKGNRTGIVDSMGNAYQFPHSIDGQILEKIDPLGNKSKIEYDPLNNPIKRTDPLKQVTEYKYDTKGNLEKIISPWQKCLDPSGNTNYTQTRYYTSGDFSGKPYELVEVINGSEKKTILNYNPKGDLNKITDPENRITRLEYDEIGRLVRVWDAENNTTEYAYYDWETGQDNGDLVINVTDARGNVTHFQYGEAGELLSITDPELNTTHYQYDANYNITRIIDAEGYQFNYEYDAVNNLIVRYAPYKEGQPRGHKTEYFYDKNNRLWITRDVLTRPDEFYYDAHGNPTKEVKWEYFYDDNGNQIKTIDPLGRVSRTVYDAANRPVLSINADDKETSVTYDAAGQVIAIRNARGYVTRATYNELGLMKSTLDPLNFGTSYTYDESGNLKTATNPRNYSTTLEYDEVHNLKYKSVTHNGDIQKTEYEYYKNNLLKMVRDARGNETSFEYDANGNQTKIIFPVPSATPRVHSVGYEYDKVNRLKRIYDADDLSAKDVKIYYDKVGNITKVVNRNDDVTTRAYNAVGLVTENWDKNRNPTYFEYDELYRLKSVTVVLGNNVRYSISYEYDAAGNLKRLIDPRDYATKFDYDSMNRLERRTDPLGRYEEYTYDPNGNIIYKQLMDKREITYKFDSGDRLFEIDLPGGNIVSYTYDENRNVKTITDHAGTIQYTYDDLDRLASHTDTFGNTVKYDYDAVGNRTTLVYPGNKTASYHYNELNRLTGVTDWNNQSSSYKYDQKGRLIRMTHPNGVHAIYTYDDDDRLINLSNEKSDGTIISSYAITRDPQGNPTRIVRNEPLEPFQESLNEDYNYDEANQIKTRDKYIYHHDRNGNLIGYGDGTTSTTFTYDEQNRLIEVLKDGILTQYTYDAEGRRIKTVYDGKETRYVHDISGTLDNVIAELAGGGVTEAENLHGLGLEARFVPSIGRLAYSFDQIGNTGAITKSTGEISSSYVYDPFGSVSNSKEEMHQPFKFVGQYGIMDEENGLYFMRARYYIDRLGLFLSVDPIFSINPYHYSGNCPTVYIDPTGSLDQEYYMNSTQTTDFDIDFSGTMDQIPLIFDPQYEPYNPEKPYCGTHGMSLKITDGVNSYDCYKHDVCYFNQIPKKKCDADFLNDMKATNAQAGTRNLKAYIYYGLVVAFGDISYNHKLDIVKNDGTSVPSTPKFEINMNYSGGANGTNNPETPIASPAKQVVQSIYSSVDMSKYAKYGSDRFVAAWRDANGKSLSELDRQHGFTSDNAPPPPSEQDIIRAEVTARDDAAQSAINARAREINRIMAMYQAQSATVRAQINALTGGQGWAAMSGRGGETYSTVDIMGYNYSYLSGYWYGNVSRIIEAAIPRPAWADRVDALNARAMQTRTVTERIIENYGAGRMSNGANTPWIPEIVFIGDVKGQYSNFVK